MQTHNCPDRRLPSVQMTPQKTRGNFTALLRNAPFFSFGEATALVYFWGHHSKKNRPNLSKKNRSQELFLILVFHRC